MICKLALEAGDNCIKENINVCQTDLVCESNLAKEITNGVCKI